MHEEITKGLRELEAQNNIEILYACESGSRCWGFASPDSDYDVRFIYKHQPDWYFNIYNQKDTIELPINDLLDIGGWELRKALQLMHKSNAPLMEWLWSPIIYEEKAGFKESMRNLATLSFSPIASFHHYHSMSRNITDALNGDEYRLKKLFYVLRATLAASWIAEYKIIPPVQLTGLLSLPQISNEIKERIQELTDIKSQQDEKYLHSGDQELVELLFNLIDQNTAIASTLPANKCNSQVLSEFLYQEISK